MFLLTLFKLILIHINPINQLYMFKLNKIILYIFKKCNCSICIRLYNKHVIFFIFFINFIFDLLMNISFGNSLEIQNVKTHLKNGYLVM